MMLDKFDRIEWESFFMSMAFLVSQRSIDRDTKHGTVVTDQSNTVLSLGYNGPPRGCDDTKVPLTRPDKYDWIVHSEAAAIINAARLGISLKDSIFYVTGMPCPKCLGEIISVGAKEIYYGCVMSNCVEGNEGTIFQINRMIHASGIKVNYFNKDVSNVFDRAREYCSEKYIDACAKEKRDFLRWTD